MREPLFYFFQLFVKRVHRGDLRLSGNWELGSKTQLNRNDSNQLRSSHSTGNAGNNDHVSSPIANRSAQTDGRENTRRPWAPAVWASVKDDQAAVDGG